MKRSIKHIFIVSILFTVPILHANSLQKGENETSTQVSANTIEKAKPSSNSMEKAGAEQTKNSQIAMSEKSSPAIPNDKKGASTTTTKK